MFLSFFHCLRALRVPVSLGEWLTLLDGLSRGLDRQNLDDFYYLSRCLLVKDLSHYDAFDRAFALCFRGRAFDRNPADRERIVAWLRDQLAAFGLSAAELQRIKSLGLEELLRELGLRLEERKNPDQAAQTRVANGGITPFVAPGGPTEISLADEGGGRSALPDPAHRYRNLRSDLTLDVRQIGVALKRLRELRDAGVEEELDLEASIEKSCRNGGEIDLVFARKRENQVRLLLVMDSGGSMDPYRTLCERLFSAADKLNYFKEFRAFYFHNCVYEKLYTNLEAEEFVPTSEVLDAYGANHRLLLVGDAAMAPFELQYQSVAPGEEDSPGPNRGIDWLRDLSRTFPRRAWLNPLPPDRWNRYPTVATVGDLFPMFPLTLDGLTRAVRRLLK